MAEMTEAQLIEDIVANLEKEMRSRSSIFLADKVNMAILVRGSVGVGSYIYQDDFYLDKHQRLLKVFSALLVEANNKLGDSQNIFSVLVPMLSEICNSISMEIVQFRLHSK